MMDFIEESREAFGVEPICKALQFAPSTYYDRRAIVREDRAAGRNTRSNL
jgi:putative transposase